MQRLLAAIGGPIFAKELIETARRKRYFVNRVLYAVTLLVVLTMVWSEASYLRGPNSIHLTARFAREVFIALNIVQYAAVWFFVPVFACGLVAAEREAQTLDLVLTARLSDREIVLGKLASRLAIVAQILLSTLPVICLVGMFGGIEVRSVSRALASTVLAMLFAGAFSIYFSSTSRSPVAALVRTYWWLAVWLIGLFAVAGVIVGVFNIQPRNPAAIIICGQAYMNPVATFIAGIEPDLDRELTRNFGGWYSSLPAAHRRERGTGTETQRWSERACAVYARSQSHFPAAPF
ncbi:MAG: ABC transporter permease [Planctomycetia bacterium]|nr:ABC transporter permease [Planctomycetia bacterium]